MLKAAAMWILLSIANCCLAQQPVSYDGIWQDDSNPGDFYSIHENGDRIVVIRLSAIKASGNTLEASYIGSKTDLLVSRVSPRVPADDIYGQLQLEFQSSTKGIVFPLCPLCTVVVTRITKIF